MSNYKVLKERQRKERHIHDANLAVRVHRALSWLNRAEKRLFLVHVCDTIYVYERHTKDI